MGKHRGGYDGFSFDVTDSLSPLGENELVVSVWDPTDSGTQPRGKQVRKPNGIWYTSTSGIWQTVWLEPVGAAHITGLGSSPTSTGAKSPLLLAPQHRWAVTRWKQPCATVPEAVGVQPRRSAKS